MALDGETKPPELSDEEQWYLAAYHELHFDRPITFSGAMVPIPITAIIMWAEHNRLNDLERDILIRVIRRIDFIECENFNKSIRHK